MDLNTYFSQYVLEKSNASNYFNVYVAGFSLAPMTPPMSVVKPSNMTNNTGMANKTQETTETTVWYSNEVNMTLKQCHTDKRKVHLTPKYFFRSNKSLHLFKTHCAFLPLFNPNIDLLQAVKVTKSGHHMLHDRASKRYGLTSQTSLHACLQRLNAMQISL